MKVVRPDKQEDPIEAKRPARAEPGMPPAVIRFALILAAIVLALVVLRRL